MKVFDLAKNLAPAFQSASCLLCGKNVFQQIKDATSGENTATRSREFVSESVFGIRIEVIEDPHERKAWAILQSANTGFPVLYEDDKGNIMEVSMPHPDFNPFNFIRRSR